MNDEERESLLLELNDETIEASLALYDVFNTVKSLSIQYLNSSEFYERKVNYYQMAPGKFRGDVLLMELKNVKRIDTKQPPGLDIHGMGVARKGKDTKTSTLNASNQLHSVDHVYITDEARTISTSYQNPSLTYMSITARADNHYLKSKTED